MPARPPRHRATGGRAGHGPAAPGPGPAAARRPIGDAAAVDVADRLHSAAIHLLRRVRREDAGAGLSAPQLSALSVLAFRGSLTLGELAHAEQVRPPTITRIVADLERAGLATRSTRESDRRVTIVSATPKGVRLLEQGRRRRIAALAAEIIALPRADIAQLEGAIDILERLVGPRMPHPR
jgi:DNA-binding MarR family transcriptional regulator